MQKIGGLANDNDWETLTFFTQGNNERILILIHNCRVELLRGSHAAFWLHRIWKGFSWQYRWTEPHVTHACVQVQYLQIYTIDRRLSACGNKVYLQRGESYNVSSPKKPGSAKYISNSKCLWDILLRDDSQPENILVTVKSNDLADESSCADYTDLHQTSPTHRHRHLAKLCGTQDVGDSWTAKQIAVYFASNGVNSASGTELQVSSNIDSL